MNNIPSNRNKSKDNPYTLGFDENKKVYTVEFKDNRKIIHKVEITEEVYQAFDKFELEDISQIHKFRKHIEHSEVYEETLYHRAINNEEFVDELVENKILNEKLKQAINELSEIQKRRIIKYYFEDKTQREIAEEENVDIRAVQYTLNSAIKKIKENLKY